MKTWFASAVPIQELNCKTGTEVFLRGDLQKELVKTGKMICVGTEKMLRLIGKKDWTSEKHVKLTKLRVVDKFFVTDLWATEEFLL